MFVVVVLLGLLDVVVVVLLLLFFGDGIEFVFTEDIVCASLLICTTVRLNTTDRVASIFVTVNHMDWKSYSRIVSDDWTSSP